MVPALPSPSTSNYSKVMESKGTVRSGRVWDLREHVRGLPLHEPKSPRPVTLDVPQSPPAVLLPPTQASLPPPVSREQTFFLPAPTTLPPDDVGVGQAPGRGDAGY
jgi:hypothetical protein